MKHENVLITGASSGIGLELARVFGKNGYPLIITAREGPELLAVADELRETYSVPVRSIGGDLEDPATPDILAEELAAHGLPVHILVNNAGLGFRGNFADLPLENDLSMLRVNIGAMVRLTKILLPDMIERRRGKILNTASVAGFEPGPHLAVYHATKAFVLSLSEALSTELENTGVTVTALCPGPTDTDFFPKADMVDTRAFQKAKVMSPQEVAEIGYKALMAEERVIVAGTVNKLMVFSRHLMPESAQAKKNEKMYEKVPPEEVTRLPGEIREKEAASI